MFSKKTSPFFLICGCVAPFSSNVASLLLMLQEMRTKRRAKGHQQHQWQQWSRQSHPGLALLPDVSSVPPILTMRVKLVSHVHRISWRIAWIPWIHSLEITLVVERSNSGSITIRTSRIPISRTTIESFVSVRSLEWRNPACIPQIWEGSSTSASVREMDAIHPSFQDPA